jgi:hypothetical protein
MKNVKLSYAQKRTIYYRKLEASSLQPRGVGEGEVVLDTKRKKRSKAIKRQPQLKIPKNANRFRHPSVTLTG